MDKWRLDGGQLGAGLALLAEIGPVEVGPEEVGAAVVGLVNVGLVVGPVGLVEAGDVLPPVEGQLDASVQII